ncbi:MAG: phenylacetate-CoA oxygenase subunit PaaC [Bacteroidia bacterium]|nr:phenylacetate-CoA oxygenase subunit PaaC [Bacteroidia bacterium]MCX7763342.1 phenylacetate-CoA oxygenase subunit PaaC [Bacteroidia bacterium]MDW8057785.1 1,2-phenylacetyl-CoA epoxidase subunit PaaC [Bacteroidia bacterium]
MIEVLEILILSLADDELFIGHRHAEWIGLGPILEEDIAFASIAQDETGHAQAYYQILTDLGLPTPDEYAFKREASAFRSAHLVELPNFEYDYGMALMRHFLYDAAEQVRLDALRKSAYEPLAGLAERLLREEKYHWLHARVWIQRLGRSTEEAHHRLQAALDQLFPYAWMLFEEMPHEEKMIEAGWVPPSAELRMRWLEKISPILMEANLAYSEPKADELQAFQGGRHGIRSPYFDSLYAEMTEVSASDPEAEW